MSKRILFEELVARREQREADKLKIGELRIPDSDRSFTASWQRHRTPQLPSSAATMPCTPCAPSCRTGISRGRSARRRTPCAPWTPCFP